MAITGIYALYVNQPWLNLKGGSVEFNNFPSDYYFKLVVTEQDYLSFRSTGSAYEVEVHLPQSWEEHCNMRRQWELGKWYGLKPQYINCTKE